MVTSNRTAAARNPSTDRRGLAPVVEVVVPVYNEARALVGQVYRLQKRPHAPRFDTRKIEQGVHQLLQPQPVAMRDRKQLKHVGRQTAVQGHYAWAGLP